MKEIKEITKIGNSFYVLVPKRIIAKLELQKGDVVTYEILGKNE